MLRGLSLAVIVIFVFVLVLQKLFGWLFHSIISARTSALCKEHPKLCRLTVNMVIGLSAFGLLMIFNDSALVMDAEDASMDWMMEMHAGIIPPTTPPFVWLDIDNKTYNDWDEPLFTPRYRLKNLINAAVDAKARLIVVDIDVSQPTPVETSQLHPSDQVLKTYLQDYVTECKQKKDKSACPPILLVRAFHSQPAPVPRTGFLEEVVKQGAPYVYWASAEFYKAEDQVARRWKLWQPACTTNQQPIVVPSIELLAMAEVKNDCSIEEIQSKLIDVLPESCGNDNNDVSSLDVAQPKTITLCKLDIDTDFKGVRQRIMYSMSWLVEDEPPDLPHVVSDNKNNAILSIYSAKAYAESPPQASVKKLTGSIVVIGGSYSDGRDIHLTPLEEMPGALIIINAIHSLLEYRTIDPLPIWQKLLITAILVIIISLLLMCFTSFWSMVLLGVLVIFVVLPLSIFLFRYGIWLDFALPLLVIQIHQMSTDFNKFRSEFLEKNSDLMIKKSTGKWWKFNCGK